MWCVCLPSGGVLSNQLSLQSSLETICGFSSFCCVVILVSIIILDY